MPSGQYAVLLADDGAVYILKLEEDAKPFCVLPAGKVRLFRIPNMILHSMW